MSIDRYVRQLALLSLMSLALLCGCATKRPAHVDNVCQVFKQYPSWYWAASDAERRWGVPIPVLMAVMHQESRFTAKAKPPRSRLLGVIPWKRPSSAYGYTQALKQTWTNYKKKNGKHRAKRDDFADAVDFVGWYANTAWRKAGIPRNDTYKLYLAYHEGIGGYLRHSYRKKKWLVQVAKKVNYRSLVYDSELKVCRKRLKRKPWYRRIL